MTSVCDFEMRSWHQQVREWNEKRVEYGANYFQILGLDENATEEQIKAKEGIVLPFDVISHYDDDKQEEVKVKMRDDKGKDGHKEKHLEEVVLGLSPFVHSFKQNKSPRLNIGYIVSYTHT